MNVLAIDPGNTESAYALIDGDRRPIRFEKLGNEDLRRELHVSAIPLCAAADVAIEMVASYGMAVGKDVFETCVWVGRFVEAIRCRTGRDPRLVYRKDIKLHHCLDSRAKDTNIRQALVDRFANGVRNNGKGTKAEPGFFYGFHSDVWSAFAIAVYVADLQEGPAAAPHGHVAGDRVRTADGWQDIQTLGVGEEL